MDDSQITEAGVNAPLRPIVVSSPSSHYAGASPASSRPLSPGGEFNVIFNRFVTYDPSEKFLQHTLIGCLPARF